MTRKSKFNVRRSTTVNDDLLTSKRAWYKNAKDFADESKRNVERSKEKWSQGICKFTVSDDPARRNALQQALRKEGIEVEVQNRSVIKQKGYEIDLIEKSPGEVAGIKSATIKMSGEYAYG